MTWACAICCDVCLLLLCVLLLYVWRAVQPSSECGAAPPSSRDYYGANAQELLQCWKWNSRCDGVIWGCAWWWSCAVVVLFVLMLVFVEVSVAVWGVAGPRGRLLPRLRPLSPAPLRPTNNKG